MAYLHCRTRTRIRTPNTISTQYCNETMPIAQTWTLIPDLDLESRLLVWLFWGLIIHEAPDSGS